MQSLRQIFEKCVIFLKSELFFVLYKEKNEDLKTHIFTGSCAYECVLDIKYLLMYCCISHQDDKFKENEINDWRNESCMDIL